MARTIRLLGLLFLVAGIALVAQAGGLADGREPLDPDTVRILWSKAEPRQVVFVPQALIGDLDLTSPETADLSHLPLTDSEKYLLGFFLFSEPDGPDGCFLPPMEARAQLKGFKPLGLTELVASKRLAASGVVRKIVPGWATGVSMPANLIFVEVEEVLRDIDKVTIPGQILVFVKVSGAELVISGKRYCSPKTESFETRVGSQVLLYGVGYGNEPDTVLGKVFEIRDDIVHPGPDRELREGEKPIPLWQLRQGMEELAEPVQ